ncbi:MAG: M3 family metallopeptidase [Proteobacteria bacterium]|nr:M3 family metallopeptidase [Pseudomonadota bacterium]
MSNPLLANHPLPAFDAIAPEHIAPAIRTLLEQANEALRTVTATDFAAEYGAVSAVLDCATERLGLAWGAVGHLKSVADNAALREAYNALLPEVSAFFTELGSDAGLYAKYRAMAPESMSSQQRRAHALAMRDFRLGGAELAPAQREPFAQNQAKQAELGQRFAEHTLDATDGPHWDVPAERLAGLPADLAASSAALARAAGVPGHRLTLHMPSYLPVLQFAQDRALREAMYRGHVTRASEFGDPALDNTEILQSLLELRHQEAQWLGFPDYASLSLASKMADSPEQVETFLLDLAHRAKPHGERDVADLRAFAAETLALDDPQPWDWTFVSERLKEARYAFSETEVKAYFPAPRVLQGLFELVQRLYGLAIVPASAPVWHPDVEFFAVQRQGSGHTLGHFYLDPSARQGKRGGAWMDSVRDRWLRPDTGKAQTPVAHMVCNFAASYEGQPPLLTHDDVVTLFHEFGHALHHLLTQVQERDIAGINGVEWDAVELPSQFMENFAWEWEVLQSLSAHVDSGEPLPQALYQRMLAARHFQSGLQTLRQVEYALTDIRLHRAAYRHLPAMEVLRGVREQVAVLPSPDYARPLHSFGHIFAGGYAAGYYSYKWAEVLSADAYAAFEEAARTAGSVIDAATGRRFEQEILAMGASRPAMQSFEAFRGRPPSLEALLRHQGMAD